MICIEIFLRLADKKYFFSVDIRRRDIEYMQYLFVFLRVDIAREEEEEEEEICNRVYIVRIPNMLLYKRYFFA